MISITSAGCFHPHRKAAVSYVETNNPGSFPVFQETIFTDTRRWAQLDPWVTLVC